MKKVAIIVVSRNRPDLVKRQIEELSKLGKKVEKEIHVVECGTDPDKLNHRYMTMWYKDEPFKGKCYAHNEGLNHVMSFDKDKKNDYYLFLHNDIFFDKDNKFDPLDKMVEIMEKHKQIGVLSPTEKNSPYPDGRPRTDSWHKVSTCDYLCLMMGRSDLENVGFLNPDFKYCWGAIHELSYKLYKRGLCVAYCDAVHMTHLGGSTYGKNTKTISREEYQKRAKQFAATYFRRAYGENWDKEFSKHLPKDIKINTYKEHRKLWES